MKQIYVVAAMISASLVLTACSSNMQTPSQSTGDINAGQAVYSKVNSANSVRREVVTKYVPVPIPGQLMPMPSVAGSPDKLSSKKQKGFLTKQAAVKYANQHATQVPAQHDFFNAMMSYGYMPGAMYTIYCAPMKITDIQFQPGEKIISTAAGDTLRWQLSQTYNYNKQHVKIDHIIVKPNASGLENTVIVTTNRRTYHLLLDSTKDGTYMVSVKWHYPGHMVSYSQDTNPADSLAGDDSEATAGSNPASSPYALDLSKLNFSYKFGLIKGSKPSWYPVRVFNNGRQTFIEFPKKFYADGTPMLFVANNNNQYGTMVNWRLKGRYMIVDTLFKKARLQTGVDSKGGKTIVQIEKT